MTFWFNQSHFNSILKTDLVINIQISYADKSLLTLVTKVQKRIRRIDLNPTMVKRNVQHLSWWTSLLSAKMITTNNYIYFVRYASVNQTDILLPVWHLIELSKHFKIHTKLRIGLFSYFCLFVCFCLFYFILSVANS